MVLIQWITHETFITNAFIVSQVAWVLLAVSVRSALQAEFFVAIQGLFRASILDGISVESFQAVALPRTFGVFTVGVLGTSDVLDLVVAFVDIYAADMFVVWIAIETNFAAAFVV